jgi:hypothetical protein
MVFSKSVLSPVSVFDARADLPGYFRDENFGMLAREALSRYVAASFSLS